jgi:AmmeMemoRadiSam system protein B
VSGVEAVRAAAVAGTFYPADPGRLAHDVDGYVGAGSADPAPKALIAPHAGYVYSGPIAGRAYARLRGARGQVTRVVLVGPAHFVALTGLAVSGADRWVTPLGPVEVDDAARRGMLELPDVVLADAPHAPEHSLEVHLPFLLRVLGSFQLVPVVVGRASPDAVAAVLETVWGGPETLIVISTDLSHYYDHDTATVLDRRTAAAVVAGRADDIGPEDACGALAVRGLLVAARRHGLRTDLVELGTSADTAGPRDRVVGYGAFALTEVAAA